MAHTEMLDERGHMVKAQYELVHMANVQVLETVHKDYRAGTFYTS